MMKRARCLLMVALAPLAAARLLSAAEPSSSQALPGGAAGAAPATGYFTHPAFLKHRTGEGHPERAERLVAIEAALKQNGLWDRLAHPVLAPASLETIGLVHNADYIAVARRDIEAGRSVLSTGDTSVSPESWDAALLAAGAVCDAVDAVLAGKLRNAFCAVRPPGHHATPARGMGFCVFNNVAIGARHALRARGLDRVLVIDWDVHHGNGTQDAFWTDPAVLQFHTQERGGYPGSGKEGERGAGAAEGRILNIEIERGSGIEVFAKLYTEQLAPAARAFKPQLILVSAGYDSHGDDPLGSQSIALGQGLVGLYEHGRGLDLFCGGGRCGEGLALRQVSFGLDPLSLAIVECACQLGVLCKQLVALARGQAGEQDEQHGSLRRASIQPRKQKTPPGVSRGELSGTPKRSRTPNLLIRSQMLYPIELWVRVGFGP